MSANVSTLTINEARAALLVAEDERTDTEIAAAVGVTQRTIERWKQRPSFAARVADHRAAFRDRALTEGFADKRARLAALNDMGTDLLAKLKEGNYEREDIKLSPTGAQVSVMVVDTPTIAQVRGIFDDIAKELGERKTVAEVTGKDGAPLVLTLAGVDLERV